MNASALHRRTFRRGSRTYSNSSLFFPPSMRREVSVLYGFVRVADDLVDSVPADTRELARFRERYERALGGEPCGDPIVDPYVELARERGFDPRWTEAFLRSMEMDLVKKEYDTLEETLQYIYGSAEVIGLFMARLMELPERAHRFARLLGRSMQYINFIRDIDEDLRLGRRYLPLQGTPLPVLSRGEAARHPQRFRSFVEHHLELYRGWQREAEEGFALIPWRMRIPIQTASAMYNWTAATIARDPSVVFRRKVRPGKPRIFASVLANSLIPGGPSSR
jgi:phytoene synthase